jgi:hypothetical protein
MTRTRTAILVLALPLIVLVGSVIYKAASGFYTYKGYMCTRVLPRVYGSPALQALTLQEVPDTTTVIDGMPIPSSWGPALFTNKLGAVGVQLTPKDGVLLEAYHHLRNLNDVRDWFASTDDGTSTEVLRRSYGSWKNVRDRFPTDLDLLDGVFDFALPAFLRQGSASMSYPFGYFLLPLFPSLKEFRFDGALDMVMALHVHQSRTWYRSVGSRSYFFISQTERSTEILYGFVEGNVRGAILLRDLNGPVNLDVIKSLCSSIDSTHATEEMEE